MVWTRQSPCKINLALNILGRRPDGFHELETLFLPIPVHDTLTLTASDSPAFELTCSLPELAVDESNLVHRAATRFFEAAQRPARGIRIHLEKNLPLAAGLGGGSANAAHTLRLLNDWSPQKLSPDDLNRIAASLGSDVNFFLQDMPAQAEGRGERVTPLPPLAALKNAWVFLFHPGFGISTPWAYQQLVHFPAALNGKRGRVRELADRLQSPEPLPSGFQLYNSLEAPALHKFPILSLYQETLRELGAVTALMSGSGSTTFAIFPGEASARTAVEPFRARYGSQGWLALSPVFTS